MSSGGSLGGGGGDPLVFYDDEVYKVNKSGKVIFGVVIEDREYASSSENEDEDGTRDSDDSDSEYKKKLKEGTVRVAWYPSGNEQVVQENRVKLSNRSLLPGDVVVSIKKEFKDEMKGYCSEIDVILAAKILGTDQIILGVNSKDVQPLERLNADIEVTLDSWVGIVKSVSTEITLKFSDDSVVRIDEDKLYEMEDVNQPNVDTDSQFYNESKYKGQVLKGPIGLFIENASNPKPLKWITKNQTIEHLIKSKPHLNVEATVIGCEINEVIVDWQCSSLISNNKSSGKNLLPPDQQVLGDDIMKLKKLNIHENGSVEIGDRFYYTIKSSDMIMSKDDWTKLEKESFLNTKNCDISKLKKSLSLAASSGVIEAKSNTEANGTNPTINNNPTMEDQNKKEDKMDGATMVKNKSKNVRLSTKSLKNKKLKKSRKDSGVNTMAPSEIQYVTPGDNVVIETIATKSDFSVVWQDASVSNNIRSTELYPIHRLNDNEYFPGDFVVRNDKDENIWTYGVVQKFDHVERICHVKWFRTYTMENNIKEPEILNNGEISEEPAFELKDHPDFEFRSGSIVVGVAPHNNSDIIGGGQVLDNDPSGKVKVWWASHDHVTQCWPQDLYKVGDYDSDEGELWEDDDDDDDDDEDDEDDDNDSWKTESEHEVSEDEVEKDDKESNEKETPGNLVVSDIKNVMKAIKKINLSIRDYESTLQTQNLDEQIEALQSIHQGCKDLDKWMDSSFFEEIDILKKIKTNGANEEKKQELQQYQNGSSTNITSNSEEDSKEGEDVDSINSLKINKSPTFMQRAMNNQIMRLFSSGGGDGASSIVDQTLLRQQNEAQASFNHNKEIFEEITHKLHSQLHIIDKLINFSTKKNEFPTQETIEKEKMNETKDEKTEEEEEEDKIKNSSTSDINSSSIDKNQSSSSFVMIESSSPCHSYQSIKSNPYEPKTFIKALNYEIKLLRGDLPEGIIVKSFEDRMDLFSVMIKGPEKTPYEDGLFFFDLQLPNDYPQSPPSCRYLSFCTDRLNPNLYEDGKVCVSLLGTWNGKGTETWNCGESNILQLLISIQGLILVDEPYFNEAGYERYKGSTLSQESSRLYNEMTVIKNLQSLSNIIGKMASLPYFVGEIKSHLLAVGDKIISRHELWINDEIQEFEKPTFSLFPISRGFKLSLIKALSDFKNVFDKFKKDEKS